MSALLDLSHGGVGQSMMRLSLVNEWQRDFPLDPRPFDSIAADCGLPCADVLETYSQLLAEGAISRIGGVFGLNAGGAGLLCAMTVPREQVGEVAARINAEPGVNHNYEREHALNLWFVATAPDRDAVWRLLARIEAATGFAVIGLPMLRAYRIDLGFDLNSGQRSGLPERDRPRSAGRPVPAHLKPLAARLESGLPIEDRPYRAIGADFGFGEDAVIGVLQRWTTDGTLRRFGVIVRHHELGWASNAMVVFSLPEDRVDAAGARLAAQPGVHLCYRRERGAGWPYDLYCMLHGRSRAELNALIDGAIRSSGLAQVPHEILFTARRFKQTGGRYFGSPP